MSRAGDGQPQRGRRQEVALWFQAWVVAQGMVKGALSVTSALGCEVSEAHPGRNVWLLEIWFHSLEERSESEVHHGICHCVGDHVNSSHGGKNP